MKERRSGLAIMRRLIVLVKPLSGVMTLAVLLGVTGFLCAIFLPILGAAAVSEIATAAEYINSPFAFRLSWRQIVLIMVIIAALRGVLHYGEQYCNHYIAFRLLALIRHQVFAKLRQLCPAKLEGKNKGDLIAIITADIELLEVFFAHTISPIAIAFLTSLIMLLFIGAQHWLAGIIALVAYIVVGVILPLWNGKRGAQNGLALRNTVADLDTFVLDSLYGMDEIIQYGQGKQEQAKLTAKTQKLSQYQQKMSEFSGSEKSIRNLIIQFFSWLLFFVMCVLYKQGTVSFTNVLLATTAIFSSFGPLAALSSLSNGLNQTLASGERVLSLLEEKAEVEEETQGLEVNYTGTEIKQVSFAYQEKPVLSDVSLAIKQGQVLGIYGASGSGKSTLLKLLMRFYDVNSGEILVSQENIKAINTSSLRRMMSYVTQETQIFSTTILDNIKVAKLNATTAEVEAAAKKAGLHDFVLSLPQAYRTYIGELGDTLSDGEKQRIGLARAFLHEADLILLDEPTSNLDALNEGIILDSLEAAVASESDKTIVLVSHRRSTLSIADRIFALKKA